MIDFAKLSGLKKTATVYLRGEWKDTTEVETPEEKDAAGNVTKAAVMKKEFTGVVVTVRALLSHETLEVQNTFDRPEPPDKKNPFVGSTAPNACIPNYDAPNYVRLSREHSDKVTAAWAAVAAGHVENGKRLDEVKEAADRAAWIRAASDTLRRELFDAEMEEIVRVSRSIANVGKGLEEASKN